MTPHDNTREEGARLSLDFVATDALCFAMEHAGVPIVRDLTIRAPGGADLRGCEVRVQLYPDLGAEQRFPVKVAGTAEQVEIGVLDFRLEPGRLRTVVERERARLVVRVMREGLPLAEEARDLEVLAYNEWPGSGAPLGLLACFVTPNDPALVPLLHGVREALAAGTGNGAIDGYQQRSTARAYDQVAAAYEAVRRSGIGYIGVPASFEQTGQKVRLCDSVLRDRLANCLDVALLIASALEQMGLCPLVVIKQGHAFCAAWLTDERFPEGVVEDAARLRTSTQLKQLVAFDPTLALNDPQASFEDAVSVATRHLADEDAFVGAIDVRSLRHAGFLPLPLRDPVSGHLPSPGSIVAGAAEARSGAALGYGEPAPDAAGALDAKTQELTRFRKWKDALLDLSLRNKLLNFRLSSRSALPLLVPDVAGFEDLLAAERAFQLLPRPTASSVDPRDEDLVKARSEDDPEVRERRLQDLSNAVVHSPLDPTELWRRAVNLDRTARSDLEEGGATTLYAAIGILRWYETAGSDQARLAPLLLYPVTLEFDRRSRRVRFRRLSDDPVPNQTLVEKLRRDFAVDLSGLVNLDSDESGVDIPRLLTAARRAVQHVPRWEVLDEAHLGHFTFTKFLMWRDLEENAQILLQNPIVRHIAEREGIAGVRAEIPDPPGLLDEHVRAAELPCVVDADATQLSAIHAVLSGANLVLQGPPGTGKSQTITNLIAAAVARGKSVLFVSEKMAALEVVHRRLKDVGLEDFCLELHSHKSNKKEVLQSFRRALERVRSGTEPRWETASRELEQLRGHLNAYVQALHAPTPLGKSYYEAASRLRELQDAPQIPLSLAGVEHLTADRYQQLGNLVEGFAVKAQGVTPVNEHPWRGSTRTSLSAVEEQALPTELDAALAALSDLERRGQALAHEHGEGSDGSLRQARDLIARGQSLLLELSAGVQALHAGPTTRAALTHPEWPAIASDAQQYAELRRQHEAIQSDLERRWTPALLERDLSGLSELFRRWGGAFFIISWFMLWSARRSLRAVARGALPPNKVTAADLTAAQATAERQARLRAFEAHLSPVLSDAWGAVAGSAEALLDLVQRSDRLRASAWRVSQLPGSAAAGVGGPETWDAARRRLSAAVEQASAALQRWTQIEARLRPLLALDADWWLREEAPQGLAGFRQWLSHWQASVPLLRPWCLYLEGAESLRQHGLEALVVAHGRGLPPDQLSAGFERAVLRQWCAVQLDRHPVLRDFDGDAHHASTARFIERDQAHIALARRWTIGQLEAALPSKSSAIKGSELDVLMREVQKKTRHMAIRRLLGAIAGLRARLKPCFLMSPLSVAQYLPPDHLFDLVVFDEASQIETHDAIGTIARGHQVIVVGDSKQLPPTRFFTRSVDTEESPDENDVQDLDSILEEAVAKGLPQKTLGWHYRSRHDALIDFSNRHYYDERLQVFPAARRYVEELGVRYHPVPDGVYIGGSAQRGGRTNPREAAALVDHLVPVLRRTPPGRRTFGVVTFSLSQRDLIQELLDEARAKFPELEPHFTGDEPLFVKNLENVQGDERDEILFSVCYARDAQGKLRQHFGPLSNQGGERRLNVAITRAKLQLRVFSTLTYDQIDLRRTHSLGAAHLREFLRFASERGGAGAEAAEHAARFDSRFEREAHEELTRAGYQVHTKVGCGGYRLDLAVVHPKDARVYALAVEMDGPNYRAARAARDRDRLRPEVLSGLGWRTHRIWSRDWELQRERERQRLLNAAAEAAEAAPANVHRPEPARAAAAAVQQGAPSRTPVLPAVSTPPIPAPLVSVPADPVEPARQSSPGAGGGYRAARLALIAGSAEELYSPAASPAIRARLEQIIDEEAPAHTTLAFRRIVGCWGLTKLTRKAHARVHQELRVLVRRGRAVLLGEFIWASHEQAQGYRGFRTGGPDGFARDLDQIAPEELANATAHILSQAHSLLEADLLRETARLFGVERLGPRVAAALKGGLQHLESQARCRHAGDRIHWVREGEHTPRRPPVTVAPASPAPPPEQAFDAVVQRLANSPIFQARLAADGPAQDVVLRAVQFLLSRNGRAPASDFAVALSHHERRARQLVALLSEALNVDSYSVLRYDASSDLVELDREKLVQQFQVGS